MKKLLLLLSVTTMLASTACKKSVEEPGISPNSPRTEVPAELQSNWMYGNFSLTEYWNQDPDEYLGRGFEVAFAFTFNADGTYTEYFTSSTVMSGVKTYHQSVSKGTVEVDRENKTIKTHPNTSHYRRTQNGNVVQEIDYPKEDLHSSTYSYTTGVETSGTKVLYLTLEGSEGPLTFLQKP
jgi:hypothetical protein